MRPQRVHHGRPPQVLKGPTMTPSRSPHPRARAQGFALIEILVAVLLFALGVLALVGLQGSLTRAQTDAKVRTDAAALASEAIGQMWADTTNLSLYTSTSCASHPRCKAWQEKVAASLPSGNSTITVTASSGDVEVSVQWTGPGGDAHQYVTQTTITAAN